MLRQDWSAMALMIRTVFRIDDCVEGLRPKEPGKAVQFVSFGTALKVAQRAFKEQVIDQDDKVMEILDSVLSER